MLFRFQLLAKDRSCLADSHNNGLLTSSHLQTWMVARCVEHCTSKGYGRRNLFPCDTANYAIQRQECIFRQFFADLSRTITDVSSCNHGPRFNFRNRHRQNSPLGRFRYLYRRCHQLLEKKTHC